MWIYLLVVMGGGAFETTVPSTDKYSLAPEEGLPFFFFFLINVFILFVYFWLHWVFIAARGLSLLAVSWGYSSLRQAGFSLQGLLLLHSTGSRSMGCSSCGTWAQ